MSEEGKWWFYEGFLGLPVPIVVLAMWLVGWVVLGSCALAPYFLWTLLA